MCLEFSKIEKAFETRAPNVVFELSIEKIRKIAFHKSSNTFSKMERHHETAVRRRRPRGRGRDKTWKQEQQSEPTKPTTEPTKLTTEPIRAQRGPPPPRYPMNKTL